MIGKLQLRKIIFLVCVFIAAKAIAVVHPQSETEKWIYAGQSTHGGESGNIYSLINVQSSSNKNMKSQKIAIFWGDKNLNPSQKLGYYHIEYDQNLNIVILSMSKMLNSKIENFELKKKFAKSILVKNAEINFDPVVQEMNLIFKLDKSEKVKIKSTEVKKEKLFGLEIELIADIGQKFKK